MFSQNAVGYLDKNCRREIEENEWLKEEVRGSLPAVYHGSSCLKYRGLWSELFPVMGLGRLLLAKESSFPVINL